MKDDIEVFWALPATQEAVKLTIAASKSRFVKFVRPEYESRSNTVVSRHTLSSERVLLQADDWQFIFDLGPEHLLSIARKIRTVSNLHPWFSLKIVPVAGKTVVVFRSCLKPTSLLVQFSAKQWVCVSNWPCFYLCIYLFVCPSSCFVSHARYASLDRLTLTWTPNVTLPQLGRDDASHLPDSCRKSTIR